MNGRIRAGIVSILIGPYQLMGEDGIRGVELAFSEFDYRINETRIDFEVEGSNAIPDSAVGAVERLITQRAVDFTIGPLSGNEGLAVRDYAKGHPDRVFLNGIAGAQDITLRDPAPNFFSFSTNGVQWTAGLGKYVYEELGYKRVVTLGEDYSFPHSQVGGFTLEYCKAGGQIVEKFWTALGTIDYSHIIQALPDDIDAIFLALAGTDVVNFLQQYRETGQVLPLTGGATVADQTIMNSHPELAEYYVGMATSSPIADNNPDPRWQAFVEAYSRAFPDALVSPSLQAWGYYVNTKAALLALKAVDGDLSNGQAAFKQALANMEFESPTGLIRLDHNRNAIADVFITVVERGDDGQLYNRLEKTIPKVTQTLGIAEDEYLQIGVFDRDNPPCRH